jgi:hypothetical protein
VVFKANTNSGSECRELSSAKSITLNIKANVGDTVLAVISGRSALTMGDNLTLLGSSSVTGGNITQSIAFAYEKIETSGMHRYTVYQASSGRMYLNLIVLSGVSEIRYTGEYAAQTTTTDSVTAAKDKDEGTTLVWGCASIYWNTSSPVGDWTTEPEMESIGVARYGSAPRLASFIDEDGNGERVFTANMGSTTNYAVAVDAVEIIKEE